MWYITLPILAFVFLLWSSAAPLFGLFSTDWFVGENGLHYGIASGCPATDSLTVPFVIPTSVQSSVTAAPASGLHNFAIWSHAGTTTTKVYYNDEECKHQTGQETFEDGQCVASPTAGKSFTVAINGTVADVCMFAGSDSACANAGTQTCYKRKLNACIKNDKGMSAYITRRRRQDAAANPSAEAPAPAETTAAAAETTAADAPAETSVAPASEAAPVETPAAAAVAETPAAAASEAAPAETPAAPAPAETPAAAASEAAPVETPAAPAPAAAVAAAEPAQESSVTFCKEMKWDYLANNVEKAMAIMCIIAGGLGVIALIAVFIETVFRWCLKPHPIFPKMISILCFIQFLAIGALCVTMIGYNQWTPPEGTHVGPIYWAVIIALGASLIAGILMTWAAIAEAAHYKGRWKILGKGRPAQAAAADASAGVKASDTESTTHILDTQSVLSSEIPLGNEGDIEMSGATIPSPPPPPGARSDSRDSFD